MENGSVEALSPPDDASLSKNTPAKRKANGDGPLRAKRNRYISIACNECKRRKIKCNGETPCHRCGNLSLECIYAPNCCSNGFRESEEYNHMNRQLTSLQEQIDTLAANLDAVQRKQSGVPSLVHNNANTPMDALARESPSTASRGRRPQFGSTTGTVYDYDGAGGAQGMNSSAMNADDGHEPSKPHSDRDPLIDMSADEALRLCAVYEDEVGSIHPMLDIEALMTKVKTFWSFMESMRRVGFLQKGVEDGESFMDGDTLLLKMVLAIACIIDGGPASEVGKAIFSNTYRIISQSSGIDQPVSVRTLKLWVLVAQYHFYSDNEIQAYRILGLAARGCFELGIHRSEILSKLYQNADEVKMVVRLLWVIYHLDRRFAFGTGMPFVMQDADLDPQLPEPDDEVQFLQLMVTHGRIASKVWTSISGFGNQNMEVRRNEMGYLDYTIQQWQSSIPAALRFQPSDNYPDAINLPRKQRHLRLLLHLYANSSRIQLYRPVLYSITSIMEDRGYAQTVVEIAKDTIRALSQTHQVADPGRIQYASTNYFLVGALAVLFLAVAHAPMEFSQHVREEFYMALGLVRHCTTNSFISRRLWSTIRGLKGLVPKLGLAPGQGVYDGSEGNPAMDNNHSSNANAPMNGPQMSYELTNLFEAASGYPGLLQRQDGGRGSGMMTHNGLPIDSFSLASGNEEDFLRIMKECF